MKTMTEQIISQLPDEEVKVKVIHSGVGALTINDIEILGDFKEIGSILLGFETGRVKDDFIKIAEKHNVNVCSNDVVYHLAETMRKALSEKLVREKWLMQKTILK